MTMQTMFMTSVWKAQATQWITSPRPMMRIISLSRISFSCTMLLTSKHAGVMKDNTTNMDRNRVMSNLHGGSAHPRWPTCP